MQFNVKPFIDKVSENQEIQNSKKKVRMKECTEIWLVIKKSRVEKSKGLIFWWNKNCVRH